jgi:hypothetical protein
MNKIFYDHLIIIEEVVTIIDAHDIDAQEKKQIMDLVEQTLHQEALNTVFTHLPKDHHETFLIHFNAAPHDRKILDFVKDKSGVDIEKAILKTANTVKKKIMKEITSAQKT